ncbi:ethanolamine ammonia-lyase subunit EutC [Neorhizobium alkalisoli]|uniref:Ethanolamine ammonia-lyase small subunit n=1 Tax=Neorhizobium alkalisoli TaxID=528178 RepID=A0A561R7M5_9HYPH|nr:ethanolamine ammonia-lyase subunit EutC [Neorhizobium alkalisoli]TWF58606.1 ethanolamine ammonia-lyase light chain [Neorhizobium alkalisoli]
MTKPAIQETSDSIIDLKEMTDARVSLGRFGAGLPTRAAQAFLLDHARAREAVWSMVDRKDLAERLSRLGFESVSVESRAQDRSIYVRRPDLGRQLSDASQERLKTLAGTAGTPDIAIIVADGLSSSAVDMNAVRLIEELGARFGAKGLKIGPIVLAEQARVALGDPAAEALGARLSIVLVGERPGLSAADSLGAYITYAPKSGTPDSKRNCVSNIRDGGLSIGEAADTIADLVTDIFKVAISGVALKDALVQLEG